MLAAVAVLGTVARVKQAQVVLAAVEMGRTVRTPQLLQQILAVVAQVVRLLEFPAQAAQASLSSAI